MSSLKEQEFQVGDRVIVHSLLKASHLNGRHGCIGGAMDASTGRYPVDLDTWVHRVMAKDDNLKKEPERRKEQDEEEKSEKNTGLAETLRIAEVNVELGTLVEHEGRPVGLILDAIRFLVGSVLHRDPDIQCGLIDIEQLRKESDGNHKTLKSLSDTAWSHWEDIRPYSTPDNQSLYQLVQNFFRELPKANPDIKMPAEFYTAEAALRHRTAVRGWNTRVEGEFWMVKYDEKTGGAYLVTRSNLNLVYKAFGVRIAFRHMVDSTRPRILRAILLPWYGRLVCDEVMVSTAARDITDDELSRQLKESVDLAIQEERVVEKLRQLEFPNFEEASQQTSYQLATPTESFLLRQMLNIPVAPPGETIWCMRRRGYKEVDNPHHMGVIINGNAGVAVGPFSCSALEPSAVDIFQALIAYCGESDKMLPSVLLIDDLNCFQRVNKLLQNFPIELEYYPPPTPEEAAAVSDSS